MLETNALLVTPVSPMSRLVICVNDASGAAVVRLLKLMTRFLRLVNPERGVTSKIELTARLATCSFGTLVMNDMPASEALLK